MAVEPITLSRFQHIVVLTGAGISAASGLPTFRGKDGIYNDTDFAEVAHARTLAADPDKVWSYFVGLRELVNTKAAPNAAHTALAALEEMKPSTIILTQNVDGLHHRAGSNNVVEVHGSVHYTRCTQCASPAYEDSRAPQSAPKCEACGHPSRLDIILFGEMLEPSTERATRMALNNCDLFIAVGTSGTVSPASNYVRSAKTAGAVTVLVNLEPMEQKNPYFDHEFLGPAEVLLPKLLNVS